MPVLSHVGACAAGPLTPPRVWNVAVCSITTAPYVMGWPFNSYSGFGTKYANPTAAAVPFNSSSQNMTSTPGDSYVGYVQSTGGMHVYRWGAAGWGTPWGSITGLGTSGNGGRFAPTGDAQVGTASTNGIYGTPWNDVTGAGTGYTAPAGNLTCRGPSFTPTSSHLFVTALASPFIAAWPFNATSGYGTKAANPSTIFTSLANGNTDVSTDGGYVFAPGGSSPYIYAYPWSGGAFGTPVTNPGSPPASGPTSVKVSPDGTLVAMGTAGTPYIYIIPWSSGAWGTRFSDPSSLPPGAVPGLAWSNDSKVLLCASGTTPFVLAYPITGGSAFGTRYSNPSTIPGTASVGAFFGNAL